MPRFTEHNGIIFTEGKFPGEILGPVKSEISRQNALLSDLKTNLAREVKLKGGDALIDFTYGQAAHKGMRKFSPFKWDTESLKGNGIAIKLSVDPRRLEGDLE